MPSDPGAVKLVASPDQPCWIPFRMTVYLVAPVSPYPTTFAPGVDPSICAPPASGPAASSCWRSRTRTVSGINMTSSRVGMGLASGSTVPRTTTLSDKVAMCSVAAMVVEGCESRSVKDSNPDFSMARICGSEGTSAKENWPCALVVVCRTLFVVRSVRETIALGIVAPVVSATFP